MKIYYSINAEGNVNDEKIVAALKTLGLRKILVDKTPDAKSFIEEQSTKAEPELMQKWLKLCKRKIVWKEEVKDRITHTLANCKLLTRKILAETIYDCCLEIGMDKSAAAQMLCRIFENLK